jgi:hypothetical protein
MSVRRLQVHKKHRISSCSGNGGPINNGFIIPPYFNSLKRNLNSPTLNSSLLISLPWKHITDRRGTRYGSLWYTKLQVRLKTKGRSLLNTATIRRDTATFSDVPSCEIHTRSAGKLLWRDYCTEKSNKIAINSSKYVEMNEMNRR